MAAKKTFADTTNPAMQFITPPPQPAPEAPAGGHMKTTDAPEGYKTNPAFVETKSRRLQLLMQPSLHDRIKARAAAEGVSVNEFIHRVLETYFEGD